MERRRTLLSLIAVTLVVTTVANSQTYTKLYSYPIGAGASSGIGFPQIMSQGRDGNLYSTISNAGTHNVGSMYMMTTAGTPTTVYNFCSLTSCTDGQYPFGGVTLGFDGNFYGTTQSGGEHNVGSVFKVTPTGTLTTLWSFANGTDESVPVWTTVLGKDNNMNGVSFGQYVGQYGAFFKVTTTTGVFKALKDFAYTNGGTPNLPIPGTDGNFYGTTQNGGDPTCHCGVVYTATAAGAITVLHKFKGYPSDGYWPHGTLVQGNDDNFYGTTYQGGAHNQGTVFKITPAGTFTLLYSFYYGGGTSFDPVNPQAGLTLGPDGNFYGVGAGGGTKAAGAIFKITPAGSETVLYNFCAVTCSDGFGAATPLVLHTDGKFYGNTNGNSLGGSVFYRLDVGFKPLVDLVNWSTKVGQTVEILGQGFTGTTKVSFGGVSAPFNNISDTYMTTTVPAGALTGSVVVTTFTNSMTSNRKFLVIPQIKSFTPTSGIVGSGVVITGVSLTQATNVTFGGKPSAFTVNSDTQITAVVPAGAKTGKIAITTPGGTTTSSSTYFVVPSISGFTPTSGPVGTSVTITGNSFTGATKVTFGGVAATSYKVINDTQVDALVPTGAITGPIAVTTAGGTGNSATNFTVN
jgi:uncharacterized repeat protein (TIGR03803 family)